MALIGSTALRIDTPDSDLDVVVYTCTSALKQKTFCGARHFIMFPKIRDSSIFVWFFVWFLPCLSIFPMISHVFPHVSWLVSLQCFSASMLSHLGSQLRSRDDALNPRDATMAFRLTYRRQCRYNTKRNKQHLGQSCGGEGCVCCDFPSTFDPHSIVLPCFTCLFPCWLAMLD